ncbi:MIP/aquaporin family protein [Mycoplasmoides pirum]|uniref:MIP/aquaporin family protein n=1 Tax=Mycoplasmoides pirum TaxID=2122 RepID=UPI0006978B4B|nr:MIP/aquaporin family protein [Mycoplasmoides pirum]
MTPIGTWLLALFSEFIGTAILILLGNGSVAAVSFKRMNANQSGKYILIALGWGFAVFIGAAVSIAMGGSGWLNPAVAISNSIASSNGTWVDPLVLKGIAALNGNGVVDLSIKGGAIAATFFIALIFEILGAMFGQIILDFINFKFIKDRENDILTIRGMHCTTPVYSNKKDRALIYNVGYEFVGTIVLLGAILAFNQVSALSNPIFVALVIMSIGISLGSATGYAINPARDLAPRLVFFGLIKQFRRNEYTSTICDWQYSWVPIAGPMVAGLIIGLIGLAV